MFRMLFAALLLAAALPCFAQAALPHFHGLSKWGCDGQYAVTKQWTAVPGAQSYQVASSSDIFADPAGFNWHDVGDALEYRFPLTQGTVYALYARAVSAGQAGAIGYARYVRQSSSGACLIGSGAAGYS